MSAPTPGLVAALEVLRIPLAKRARERVSAEAALVAELNSSRSVNDVWLTLAVVGRALPTETEVRQAHRLLVAQGAAALLERIAKDVRSAGLESRSVELLAAPVIVDVRHTAETDLATGIQRVVRQTIGRWERWHEIVLVTWSDDGRAMRRLMPDEHATAVDGKAPVHGSTRVADRSVVVPIGGIYVLPELAAEVWRTERVGALAEFGNLRSCLVGHDCVPLTTAETVGAGMPGAFARNLMAVSRMTRVSSVSEASATEYRGWRRMLSASGIEGPDVTSILLAAEPGAPSAEDDAEFKERLELGDSPLVLVVGSHEPRKNHNAVIQAAELAWREGLDFQLVFLGGNSWNSLDFSDMLMTLQAAGRPVTSVSALSDRMLWAGYRLSRFTIFTSLNEGFGLPVAESLASGTPVLTSNYGSMQQIAAAGGALVVDPRDDLAILGGIRSLLTDAKLYARLKAEAAAYTVRPWDDYATELWDYFVES